MAGDSDSQRIDKEWLDKKQESLEGAFNSRKGHIKPEPTDTSGSKRIVDDLDAIRRIMGALIKMQLAIKGVDLSIRENRPRVDDLKERLLPLELTDWVRWEVGKILGIELTGGDYKDLHFEAGKQAINDCNFLMGGQQFLQDFFQKNEDHIQNNISPEIADKIVNLREDVALAFGENYRDTVSLLFHCLRGDIRTLERIVNAQAGAYRDRNKDTKDPGKPDHFFEHLRRFIAVYADVSQHLIVNSRYGEKIKEASEKVLELILQDRRLQLYLEVGENSPENLYSILRGFLNGDTKKTNPWFCGNLKNTPFDPQKIGSLITYDVPRQALAAVLWKLDDYQLFNLARKIRTLEEMAPDSQGKELKQYERSKKDVNTLVYLLTQQYQAETGQEISVDQLIGLAKTNYGYDPLDTIEMTKERRVSPRDIIVRLIDPEKIVKSTQAQDECHNLLEQIEDSDSLNLAKSLQELLWQSSLGLDVPLKRGFGGYSIRRRLMRMAITNFSENQLRYGPEYGLNNSDLTKGKPILRMLEAEMLETNKEELKNNFNTAGVGVASGFLKKVAEAMLNIESYDGLMSFFRKEVELYLKIDAIEGEEINKKGDRKKTDEKEYQIFPNYSASIAFKEFLAQCLPKPKKSDYMIVTDHEYGGITELLQPKESGEESIKTVYLNKKEEKRPKTPDELFVEISQNIDPTHPPQMIILSSKTRLGDAPCSLGKEDGGKKNNNVYYLAQLVSRLKREYPMIPVMVDACQSLGRSEAESLRVLKPDIYLASGSKALGAGGAGFIALSQGFLNSLPPEHQFEYNPSTLPMKNIVALALALRALGSKEDMTRLEGNMGSLREKKLEQKIADRMAALTEYTIKKAENYWRDILLEYPDKLVSCLPVQMDDKKILDCQEDQNPLVWVPKEQRKSLLEAIKCQIEYPVHRNKIDYTGIITLNFAGMDSVVKLVDILRGKGFKILPCLKGQRAIRISFHYLHEEKDIDNLFEAIKEAHLQILQDNSKKKDGKKH